MTLEQLKTLDNWNNALIIFRSDNWKDVVYTEKQRTYRINRNNNFFDNNKISTSLYGDCLDGIDVGVRLDLYRWKIEKIILIN